MKTFRTKSVPHRPARRAHIDRIRAAEGDFLGHPRGLTFLFTTEALFLLRNARSARPLHGEAPAAARP